VSGITARSYKSGSVIYFENDKSEYIYILKTGKVVLNYLKPETGEEIKENIKAGEFFGVKSALGRYPREETAQTLTDTSVLVLTLADFEHLLLGNVAVVKKMLSVFSNQLRRIGKAVREVLGETNVVAPDAELYKIGDYYYRNSKFNQATYAYKRYMTYYPDGANAQSAMQRIRDIESGNVPQFDGGMMDADVSASASGDGSFGYDDHEDTMPADMTDFDIDDGSGMSGHLTRTNALANEMDDFLSSGPALDDFGLDSPPAGSKNAVEKLRDAQRMIRSGNIQDGITLLKDITDDHSMAHGSNQGTYEQAHIELGKALMQAGRQQEAMQAFSLLVKNNPQSKFVKTALLHVGIIFQQTGNKQKAAAYFQKVAEIAPMDDVSADAKKRLTQIG
jgi:CRP-like cAMP-binding protein